MASKYKPDDELEFISVSQEDNDDLMMPTSYGDSSNERVVGSWFLKQSKAMFLDIVFYNFLISHSNSNPNSN